MLLIWVGFFVSSQADYVAPAYTHPITAVCVSIIGLKIVWRKDTTVRSPLWVRAMAWLAIGATSIEVLSALFTEGQLLSDQVNRAFPYRPWARGQMGLDTAIVTFVTLITQKFRKRRAMLLMVSWAISCWILTVTGLGKLTGLPLFGGKMSDFTLVSLAVMQASILVMMLKKSPFKVVLAKSAAGRTVRWIMIGGFGSTSLALIASYRVGIMTGNFSARDLSLTTVALSAVATANLVLVLWLGAYAQLSALRIERNQRRIAYQRDHDHLTGLINRRAGTSIVEDRIGSAARGNDRVAIALMDIDFFKVVNDTLGHQAGDKVLTKVARKLRSHVRDTDVLVRWGGEEFLLCLSLQDGETGRDVVERLRVKLQEAPILGGTADGRHRITVSFGVTEVTASDHTLQTVISRADQALLRAKDTGRNRVVVAPAVTPLAPDETGRLCDSL